MLNAANLLLAQKWKSQGIPAPAEWWGQRRYLCLLNRLSAVCRFQTGAYSALKRFKCYWEMFQTSNLVDYVTMNVRLYWLCYRINVSLYINGTSAAIFSHWLATLRWEGGLVEDLPAWKSLSFFFTIADHAVHSCFPRNTPLFRIQASSFLAPCYFLPKYEHKYHLLASKSFSITSSPPPFCINALLQLCFLSCQVYLMSHGKSSYIEWGP